MSGVSAIEWTDATWNPVTGCSRVSPGCANCYIERTPPFRMAGRRFEIVGQESTTGVQLKPERIAQPLRWRKSRRVFVCSLADLFHDDVPDHFIYDVFQTMHRAPQHTFQVLTKRPERLLAWYTDFRRGFIGGVDRFDECWPLPNVWLGVSIENARYTWRADVLREIPAAVRFISAEPLLGSLFEQKLRDLPPDPLSSIPVKEYVKKPLGLTGIDWVIIGGESGPGARPFHLEHAREIVRAAHDACWGCRNLSGEVYSFGGLVGHAADEPCTRPAIFVKQLGARPVHDHPIGLYPLALRDRKGGDIEEWPPDLRIREFPAVTS